MTHFGALTSAFPGHLNPMMALGRELQQRGHRLTFLQIQDKKVRAKLEEEELEFYPIGEFDYPDGSLNNCLIHLGKLDGISAVRYWHREHQILSGIICRDVPKAIEKLGIETLLVDQLEPAGAAVAEYLDIPFITICNALILNREPGVPPIFTNWTYRKSWWAHLRNQIFYHLGDLGVRQFNAVLADYRREWKLPRLKGSELLFANSQLAQISQQPKIFDFPREHLPKCFHYTGPFRHRSPQNITFPFERLTGQPLIYASLGTLQTSKYEIFYCIAEACTGIENIQLVITHGGGMSKEQQNQLPGSPLVVSYAPQLQVLEKASLAITHAGLNTVLDALSCGVPLLAIPITFEQPAIGAQVKYQGVGEVIPAHHLDVFNLRATIQKMLQEHSYYAQRALSFKRSMQGETGVKKASDIIERVVFSRRPVFSEP